MTELVLVDNTDVGVATLVDLDTFTPLGIAAAGENRAVLLNMFRDATPFDLTLLDVEAQRRAFQSFLSALADESADTATPQPGPVEPQPSITPDVETTQPLTGTAVVPDVVGDTAPAEIQPATDSVATVKVRCFNCNGVGAVEVSPGEPPQQCNMCGGRGWVERVAA